MNCKRTTLIISTILFLSLSSHARAEILGNVSVRDNLANPAFPTHIVALYPKRTERGASNMRIRCQNNQTEVYVEVDGVFGHRGKLRVKWPKMGSARDYPTSSSTDGGAAFLSNPISFVQKLVSEGSVVVEAEGYNVFGAAEYRLNEETTRGIYALATTCQWIHRLPKAAKDTQSPVVTPQKPEGKAAPASAHTRTECERLTEQFERRKAAVDRLDVRREAYWGGANELLDLHLKRDRACKG